MIKKDFLQVFMTFFGLTVAGLIVIVGFYIVFSQRIQLFQSWPKEIRTIFGVFIISYGLFRSVVIYQKNKNRRDSDNESEF
jgi:divalent metal cation (Fe/Co/Zn/Cd) transporter